MDMFTYNELYHHGVKGQRWGVRRYQNEDGTLTSAGKQRYGKLQDYAKNNDYTYKKAKLQTKESYEKGEISRSEYRQLSKTIRTEKRNNSIYNKKMTDHMLNGGMAAVGTFLASGVAFEACSKVLQSNIGNRCSAAGAAFVGFMLGFVGTFAPPIVAVATTKKSMENTKYIHDKYDSKRYSK